PDPALARLRAQAVGWLAALTGEDRAGGVEPNAEPGTDAARLAGVLDRLVVMLDELARMLAWIGPRAETEGEATGRRDDEDWRLTELTEHASRLLVTVAAHRDAAYTLARQQQMPLPDQGLIDPLDPAELEHAGPALRYLVRRSPQSQDTWSRYHTERVVLTQSRQSSEAEATDLPAELSDAQPTTKDNARERSARWWRLVEASQKLREAFKKFGHNNREVNAYLQRRRQWGSSPPEDELDPALEREAELVDDAVLLAGRGPVEVVYRGEVWGITLPPLPSDPVTAAAILAGSSVSARPFALGDVRETDTIQFVTYDRDYATGSYANASHGKLAVLNVFITDSPVWLGASGIKPNKEALLPRGHRSVLVGIAPSPLPGIDFQLTWVDEHLLPADPSVASHLPTAEGAEELLGELLDWFTPLDARGWRKISGQRGSNAGGTYRAPDGTEYYVKQSPTREHARSEVLTAVLARLTGTDTAEVRLVILPGGRLGVASKIRPGAGHDFNERVHNPRYRARVHAGFAPAAWLANWDVVAHGENTLTDGDEPFWVDLGGGLLFRAQGKAKGAKFGAVVTEWDVLRGLTSPHDPQARNPDAASVFGDITDAAMKASAQHVLGVSPAQIDAAVAAAGFTPTKAQ
ncbi:MAG: hypothetical protein J2P57_24145, partial [Acidimicrobiaceae bacterium]|nr:hypothetical protein [Acidimicrobiaceae bacterium]